ncbi:hypothetical protein Mgra_00005882 [Meloidogyne graminicola]|uniref:asparaginase n=1 Tax=Meloidogyne graminicola TaxID=189291 RepID=A0A8S9ZMU1_9BILA|nr:hypothetical protein Mgra_00005882 [Meloidogyne graminicola]
MNNSNLNGYEKQQQQNINNNTSSINSPLDDSFKPKNLTAINGNSDEYHLFRNLSATKLAELQESDNVSKNKLRRISECDKELLEGNTPMHLQESKVLVLYTGGTIGMKSCGADGVYAPEQYYLPKIIRNLPPLNDKEFVEYAYPDAQLMPYALPLVRGMKKRVVYWLVEYEPLLDSSDMTFDDWTRIAKDIRKSYSAYDGFVILHGTDTLAYTACALSFMMENLGKTVVITGSQIPVGEVRSDGRENMIGALIVAGNLDIPEVCVLFNNRLFRGNRCTKIDNRGLEAFDSPNMAPLATLDISINVNYESIFRSSELRTFKVQETLCRNVVVLRIFPSLSIESVRALLGPPTQGVVLQTYGSGNVPAGRTDIMEEIKKAVERGCLVVNISQCPKGIVTPSYQNGKILAETGVIFGSDMTTEAALTKLAYVLAKQEWSLETKAMMLRRNLAGELTVARSEQPNELDMIPRLAKHLRITSSNETQMLRKVLFPPLSCHAAFANDIASLEKLRLSGADLSGGDYSMRTPLHIAAAAGNAETVEYLLRQGASVHIRDSSDENALVCAVHSRNLEVIRMIRQAGGELVQPKQRIGVELCLASFSNDLQALKAWHEAGADLSTSDYSGRTALHISSARGFDQLCLFLCKTGNVSPMIKDLNGRTAYDEALFASEEGRVEDLIAPNFQNILALFVGFNNKQQKLKIILIIMLLLNLHNSENVNYIFPESSELSLLNIFRIIFPEVEMFFSENIFRIIISFFVFKFNFIKYVF